MSWRASSVVPDVIAALAVGAVLGFLGSWSPIVAAGLVAGPWVVVLAVRRERWAFAAWWGLTAALPIWWGYAIGGFQVWPGVILAAMLLLGRLIYAHRVVLTGYDLCVAGLWAIVGLAWVFADTTPYVFFSATGLWLVPYVLVRLLGRAVGRDFVHRVIWAVGCATAVWAVVEFAGFSVFDYLTFAQLPELRALWEQATIRGGFARSSAALGHPIALGAFLAMAIPFALTARRGSLATTVLISAGVAATLSRSALLATVIAAGLALLGRGGSKRLAPAMAALTLAASVGMWFVGADSTTQVDLSNSTDYRQFVLQTALGKTDWFGAVDPSVMAQYISVDNAYLLTALQTGRLAAIALMAALGYSVFNALVRRDGPATAAAGAMAPVLATVALITQWQMLVFAMLALAACERELAAAKPDDSDEISQLEGARVGAGQKGAQ